MIKQLRKGQAEVIGGLMVVSVLLLIIIPLILNTMTSSTNVGTRNYVLRSQFEIERWSERLVLSADKTRLENPSTVEITIVRIWRNISGRSEPYDLPRPINISVGGYLPINQLVNNLAELEAVVTARGRVIKIQELLPPSQGGEGGEGGGEEAPLGLTGEEITGGNYLYNYSISVLKCQMGSTNCTTTAVPAIYYYGRWIANRSNAWVDITNEVDRGEIMYSDLDENKAPELVILYRDNNNNKYYVLKDKDKYEYTIRIRNYTRIKADTKLIAIYIKLVTRLDKTATINTFIRATLVYTLNNAINISNYATLSTAKIPQIDRDLAIYEGYVIFPVKQFEQFSSIVGNYPGDYHLDIEVRTEALSSTGNIPFSSGIEYLAVVSN